MATKTATINYPFTAPKDLQSARNKARAFLAKVATKTWTRDQAVRLGASLAAQGELMAQVFDGVDVGNTWDSGVTNQKRGYVIFEGVKYPFTAPSDAAAATLKRNTFLKRAAAREWTESVTLGLAAGLVQNALMADAFANTNVSDVWNTQSTGNKRGSIVISAE